jgi:thiol-disulfide isomerase/thioredoxin
VRGTTFFYCWLAEPGSNCPLDHFRARQRVVEFCGRGEFASAIAARWQQASGSELPNRCLNRDVEMQSSWRLLSVFVLSVFVISASVSPSGTADEKSGKPAAVELTDGTWKDVEALIAKNSGKVVVVDLWSTACLPCMTEFPNLVALQKAHPDKVVCISFNLDYAGIKSKGPDYYRPKVEAFLKKQMAGFANVLSTDAADKVFEDLELTSIPAVYVYGKDGKLAKRFDDSLLEEGKEEAFTYTNDINPFVEKLLTK